MHGFSHIVGSQRHFLEKFAWLCMTVLAVAGAAELSLGQWRRFVANPTVVALEKDFRSWNFTFPAITTCLSHRVDSKKLPAVIKEVWNVTEEEPERYTYLSRFVETVANAKLTNLGKFNEFVQDERLNVNMTKIALEVFPNFKAKTYWFSRSIRSIWISTMTERGLCHTINSLATVDYRILIPGAADVPQNNTTVSCQYFMHSCYARIEIYDICASYYIHSPFDILDISQESMEVCSGEDITMDYKVAETKAAPDIQSLKVEQRQCLFFNEPQIKNRKTYGAEMCRASCRNKLGLKLCGCRPFFNIREEGPICNISGLACLSKYTEKILSIDSDNKICPCLVHCIDSTYEVIESTSILWEGSFANRASLKVAISAPKSRYKREIVFSFEDLVVSFGGAAGLFLGCSFLSFVEIAYFIIARVASLVYKRKRDNVSKINPAINSNHERMMELEMLSHGRQGHPKFQFIKCIAEGDMLRMKDYNINK